MPRKGYSERKWKDEFYVRAYRAARDGLSDKDIAAALGVTPRLFNRWLENRPALAEAVRDGRGAKGEAEDIKDHIYGRLPEHLRDLWDRIEGCEALGEGDEPELRLERRRTRRALDIECKSQLKQDKQRLFIHALVCSQFNRTKAAERCALPMTTVQGWAQDEMFQALLMEIDEAKKDFFETALINLVRQGDTAATIFANKTKNRDRGYSERMTLDINRGNQRHALDELGLTLEEKRQILLKIREKEAARLGHDPEVADAEFTVKEAGGGQEVG